MTPINAPAAYLATFVICACFVAFAVRKIR